MIGVKYNFMSNLKYYYYEKNVFIKIISML